MITSKKTCKNNYFSPSCSNSGRNCLGAIQIVAKNIPIKFITLAKNSIMPSVFRMTPLSMNEMYIQCIGIRCATAIIGLMNLTYNMYRKIQLMPI